MNTELPRALEDYFAFAETTPTRNGRRFSITLPYLDGDRLDRLQWWYHVSPAQELMYDGMGLAIYRARAIERFLRHIDRWLEMTDQQFHGADPIPRISRCEPQTLTVAVSTRQADISEPVKKVAVNG
jgi:hypothetical protein